MLYQSNDIKSLVACAASPHLVVSGGTDARIQRQNVEYGAVHVQLRREAAQQPDHAGQEDEVVGHLRDGASALLASALRYVFLLLLLALLIEGAALLL